MGQIFDAERQAEMQQNMWNFQQMMMTVNPTLMNSPCSCLSVYQPCRGPQADVSGPEPCTFRVGTSSTVGHSISGPGPNQCDSMPTRRRQTVDNQSGPYSSQLRSTSPTSAGAQLGSAVRQHDYDGVPVQSTYFHNSKLPATLISFFIAGETILEVPHPMFSQLFVHSVVASFSCTSLEENMATPTDTDWNQVYTLMLKRLAKDLHDSHNRLKNALELNRIQEYQQRYILNDRYFQTAGYTPENRLTTISESFATFCNRHWVNKLKWQHLCVNYACTLVVRFVPIVPLLNISRTCHWSVTMGNCWESNCIWIFLKLNMWTLILNPVTLLLTIVRNLLLQKFFEKVSFAPVLHNTRIRFILQAFYCCAEICRDHSSAAYLAAQIEAFRKASKYSHYKDPFRPFCIYGKARSRQSHHLTISVGGTVSDHGGLQFFDCIHSHRDKRWSFRSHLCQIFGIAAFL